MQQIVYGEQWIRPEAPPAIREIFYRYGEKRIMKKGEEIVHGGLSGEITLLMKGLCLSRFWDVNDKEHVLAIVLPNRTMGDIDAVYEDTANVSGVAIRDSVVLVLPYKVWRREITANVAILEEFLTFVVKKQETHIESLLACFTLEVDVRLRSFLLALIKAYYSPNMSGWNPVPIRISTVLLARIISSSRPSVSVILNGWVERGLLKRDGQFFLVHGELFKDIYDWWEKK